MKPKVIMFDVDGVLADFILGFTTEANILYGTPIIGTRDHKTWDFKEILSKDQINIIWNIVTRTEGWWVKLRPLVSSSVFSRITQLQLNNNLVYFVTSRNAINSVLEQTNTWLRFVGGINNPNVIVTKHKGEIAKVIEATHTIDDKWDNAQVIHWISDKPQTKSYLINRPYNMLPTNCPEIGAKGIIRVDTVDQFIDDIKGDYNG